MYLKNSVLIYTIGMVLLYDVIVSIFGYSLTDGWWESYIFFSSNPNEWYENLGLRLPPLFPYLLSLSHMIIGDDFTLNSFVFSIVHTGAFIFTYKWLRERYSALSAIIGGLIATIILFSETTYNPKDYHTILFFLLAFFLYIFKLYLKNNTIYGYAFLASLTLAFIFLTKHNVGLVLIANTFIGLLINYYYKERTKEEITGILIGVCVVTFACLITYSLIPNIVSLFNGANEKGSLFTVFFRFLIDKTTREIIIISFVSAMVILSVRNETYQSLKVVIMEMTNKKVYSVPFVVIFIIGILALTTSSLKILSITLITYFLVFIAYNVNKRKIDQHILEILVIISIVYTGTMTAGLNQNSLFFLAAIVSADVFEKIRIIPTKYKVILIVILSMVPFINLLKRPYVYSWWGYHTQSIFEQNKGIENIDFLKYKFVDDNTNEILKQITSYKDIATSSKILSLPSIPVIYKILNKKEDYSPVLWFDVTSADSIEKIMHKYKKSAPEYIFYLKPSFETVAGHQKLARNLSLTSLKLINQIDNDVRSGKYKIVYKKYTHLSYGFDSKLKVPVKTDRPYGEFPISMDFSSNYYLLHNINEVKHQENDLTLEDSSADIFYILKLNPQ